MAFRDRVQQVTLATAVVAGETTKQGMHAYGNLLRRANVGVGALRFTPEGAGFVRDLMVEQLRSALELSPEPGTDATTDVHGASEPAPPDPFAVAAALLELQPDIFRDLVHHEPGDGVAASSAMPRLSPDEHLQASFAALLDPQHADVGLFPALMSIVSQLSPDQARMLRHLHLDGPAPAVDVVAVPKFAVSGTTGRLVAQSLNVLTDRSGGEDAETGPAHLHNVIRLGLVAIENRELPGHGDYDLIESGRVYATVVAEVAATPGLRAKTVRQTVRLTPLGLELARRALTPALSSGLSPVALKAPSPA